MAELSSFPQLRDGVRLKKYDDYVLIYGFEFALHDLIHPSHAFLLSLCTGGFSSEQIEYLMAETYQLPPTTANEIVSTVLQRFDPFLTFLQEPDYAKPFRYQPKEFLYDVDGAVFEDKRCIPLPVPIGISLSVTLFCNFRCRYCYQTVFSDRQRTLEYDRCLDLVAEAADWGVSYVGITGGEPTLFQGWMNLIEQVISCHMVPGMTTNGTVIGAIPDTARRLRDIGLKEITVSLDASKPDLHHFITDSHNSFTKVINAIRFLVDAGIRTSIKHVLTPLNIRDLEDFIDFASQLGVAAIGISHMEPGAPGSESNALPNITAEQLLDARSIVQSKQKDYQSDCEIIPPRDASHMWGENDWYPCGGLYTGMSIFPSGRVTICDKLGDVDLFSYGNVHEQGLQELWNGHTFRSLRAQTVDPARIDPDCASCSKLSVCRTGCFVESRNSLGDYFAKHPNCTGPF